MHAVDPDDQLPDEINYNSEPAYLITEKKMGLGTKELPYGRSVVGNRGRRTYAIVAKEHMALRLKLGVSLNSSFQ